MKWEQNFGGGEGGRNFQSVAQNRIVSNGWMVKQFEENGEKTCWPNLRHHSGIRLEEMAQIKEMNPQVTLRAAF